MIFRLCLAIPLLATLAMLSFPVRQSGLALFMDDNGEAAIMAISADGFTAPDGIAWHNNQLYLADEGGNAVLLRTMNKEIHRLADADAKIQSPEDVVVHADGTIFFTDDDAGGLWQINAAGAVSQLADKSQGLMSTEGLAIAPNGNLIVGDGEAHAIFEVTRQGEVSVFLGPEAGISKPESLVFDGAENLYIADNRENIVYRLDRDHKLQTLITARDGLTQPESICYHDGNLYITDDEAGKLYCYTPRDGLRTLAVFAGRLKYVQGITVGPEGSLLITVQDPKHKQGLILKVARTAEHERQQPVFTSPE